MPPREILYIARRQSRAPEKEAEKLDKEIRDHTERQSSHVDFLSIEESLGTSLDASLLSNDDMNIVLSGPWTKKRAFGVISFVRTWLANEGAGLSTLNVSMFSVQTGYDIVITDSD